MIFLKSNFSRLAFIFIIISNFTRAGDADYLSVLLPAKKESVAEFLSSRELEPWLPEFLVTPTIEWSTNSHFDQYMIASYLQLKAHGGVGNALDELGLQGGFLMLHLSLETLIKAFKSRNKKAPKGILFEFGHDQCPPCVAWKNEFLLGQNSSFKKFLADFLLVDVRIAENGNLIPYAKITYLKEFRSLSVIPNPKFIFIPLVDEKPLPLHLDQSILEIKILTKGDLKQYPKEKILRLSEQFQNLMKYTYDGSRDL